MTEGPERAKTDIQSHVHQTDMIPDQSLDPPATQARSRGLHVVVDCSCETDYLDHHLTVGMPTCNMPNAIEKDPYQLAHHIYRCVGVIWWKI